MCFGGGESFYNYGIMLTFIMRGMFSVLRKRSITTRISKVE